MYHEAVRVKISEFEGNRPIRDFLIAIQTVNPFYSSTRKGQRKNIEVQNVQIPHRKQHQFTMVEEIQAFRQDYRENLPASSKVALATEKPTLKGKDQEGKTKNKKDKERPTPTCLCGDKHFWNECSYIVPPAASSGWVEDPAKRKKVDDALKNPTIKERVDIRLKKAADWAASKGKKPQTQTQSQTPPTTSERSAHTTFYRTTFCVDHTALATDTQGIEVQLIHDAGSNVHVCNKYSAHLYTKVREAAKDDYLNSGNGPVKIESWGMMHTAFQSESDGLIPITLQNVAFIGSFTTSLVSQYILGSKGVCFDSGGPHLYDKETRRILYQLYINHTHYTFSESGIPHISPDHHSKQLLKTTTATPTVLATDKNKSVTKPADDWHKIMAHASGEAISHLQDSSTGIKVIEASVPKTNECETCALTKSQSIISRSDQKSEHKDHPFYRISIDLIQFEVSMTGHEWATHIACMVTDFNILATHRTKSECREFILDTISLIKVRWNRDVVFIRSDNEKSYSNDFKNELQRRGITLESSAPETPAQNGHAERKGKMLVIKARALRLEADLPHYLWPEAIHTACCLANRTPTAKHGWKTPFELVMGNKPQLSHLKIYGCKAYALNRNIPKKEKLEPKAHIGYLVGYDSTNIFRIWIPSKRKVIRSRDVLFDETEVYSLADPPDLLHFQSTTGEHAPYVISERMRNALADLDDEDQRINNTFDLWDETAENTVEISPPSKETVTSNEKSTSKMPGEFLDSSRILPTPSPTPSLPERQEEDHNDTTRRRQEEEIGLRRREEGFIGLPRITDQRYRVTKNRAPQAKQISADLNVENVSPEGSKRQRKQTRREGYDVLLTAVSQGSTDMVHDSFAAFSKSSDYIKVSSSVPTALNTTESSTKRLHRDNMPPEPKGFKELAKHPHCEQFKESMRHEIKTLQKKATWEEVPIDEAANAQKTPIPTMWVFRYKFDENGWLVKFKARLVARGDLQKTDMDTYAATLAARLFRFLMALVAFFGLETRQYDAVNAFANANINEPTYCKLPPGWPGRLNILLRLLRALYGLKQSPALWHNDLFSKLVELGLEPLPGVDCIFTNSYMIVFFFVDDICVIYSKRDTSYVDVFESKLFQAYEMKALGEINWFLGIRVTRNREARQLWLCQESYIDKITTRFNIKANGRKSPLPVEDIEKYEGKASPQDVLQYQEKVGSINFPAVITRPDLAHAVSKLSEHLMNPSPRQIELVNGVIGYLVETRSLCIRFDGRLDFHSGKELLLISSDASFADDLRTRHSSQGYAFKLFGGLIDWRANKQKTVTLSSTEAELLAISQAGKEGLWWNRLFEMLEFDPGDEATIECDSQQTIRAIVSKSPRFTTKLRHVDIHAHWLRQEVTLGTIAVKWVPSAEIIADGFTKILPIQRHKEFLRLLGLVREGSESWE